MELVPREWLNCCAPFCLLTPLEADKDADASHRGKREAVGDPSRSDSDDDDLMGAENHVEENAAPATLEELLTMSDPDLQSLVGAVNKFNKERGYRALNVRKERDNKAYYICGCRANGCGLVTFSRTAASKKGGRKVARVWTVKSVGPHLCEPVEPFGVALANTWIPEAAKRCLVGLYEQGIGPAAAYDQVVHFAGKSDMPLTWEKSDVKNFYDTLERLFGDERIVDLLDSILKAGHFVAVDLKQLPDGKCMLNRVFVATVHQQQLFRLFGSVSSLDATYGKNELQLPAVFLTGLTNEGRICSFGTAILRSETNADYLWLMQAVRACFKMLSRAMVIDGDVRTRNAINEVARDNNLSVRLFLCVWHLFKDLEKNLLQKTPGVNVFDLKRDFYEMRGSTTEESFHTKWSNFEAMYGTNSKTRAYLQDQLFALRELWVVAWTGREFTAGMMTTGISESFHALLASGKSGMQTLSDLFVKLDAIGVQQTERSLKSAASWEADVLSLEHCDVAGFVALSVSTLLSGYAFKELQTVNANSCFFSVASVDCEDAQAIRSWNVTNVHHGTMHVVSERHPPPLTPDQVLLAQLIYGALSKDVDLGKHNCACCRSQDEVAFARGHGFRLPPRWPLLYQVVKSRRRVIFALGFGEPKETGSSNNKTAEGVLDVLREYEAALQRHIGEGLTYEDAHVLARSEMCVFEYGGRALGTPKYKKDNLWLQCGVLDGEESLPREHKRDYCGLWFHARCIGILRVPKDKSERTACLTCLQVSFFFLFFVLTAPQVRQYRVKPPPIDALAQMALYHKNGRPRILSHDPESRFRLCSCRARVMALRPPACHAHACSLLLAPTARYCHFFITTNTGCPTSSSISRRPRLCLTRTRSAYWLSKMCWHVPRGRKLRRRWRTICSRRSRQ